MQGRSQQRIPTHLRCNNLSDPMGIHDRNPRLSWWLNDDRPAEIQTAYQLLVASTPEKLSREEGDLWDSGKVESHDTTFICYGGSALGARMRAFWKVRSFDSDGLVSLWSEAGSFELGLLGLDDWKAHWVSTPLMGDKHTPVQVPALRREFEVDKAIVSARLYVSALGIYDIEINGLRAIDLELAPGWTDYSKRVCYQAYDVTHLLDRGENVLGALLADGWYCGALGNGNRQQYGDRPELLVQLEIYLDDGCIQTVISDKNWQWYPSEILYSDMQKGESVDLRQTLGDWSRIGYTTTNWYSVLENRSRSIDLSPTLGPGVRVIEELEPDKKPSIRELPQGGRRFIYDLGENIVGRIRIWLRAEPGALVRFRYAERLDDEGELYFDNLRSAEAIDYLTCAGSDSIFEPRFTFHGFQFVEISGQLDADAMLEVKGMVLSSVHLLSGEFECDHGLINQLQSNIVRSQQGNYIDLPMSGPQRDERLGSAGEAHLFARTAAFNSDMAAFYSKWMQDLVDAQGADGSVPAVAPLPPQLDIPLDGGPGWSDAIILCPWTMYRCYGDKALLEQHYFAMKAFLTNLEKRYPDFIRADAETDMHAVTGEVAWRGYGDCLAADGILSEQTQAGNTPRDLIGTAYYCYCAGMLARIAGIIGNLADLDYYQALSQKIRAAFRARFVTVDGRLVSQTQTAYVLALHFGLLNRKEQSLAIRQLVIDIEERNYHLSTGKLGTPYLLDVLTRHGQLAVAYRMLMQTSAPGWLYPITQGATSIWERWDGWTEQSGMQNPERNSFNHCAFGAVGEWLYSTLGGLDLAPDLAPARNAYRHLLIRPQPPIGEQFPGSAPIRWVRVALETNYGRVESEWDISNDTFTLQIKIPANCSATVILPDGGTHEVASGRHNFEMKIAKGRQQPAELLEQLEVAS